MKSVLLPGIGRFNDAEASWSVLTTYGGVVLRSHPWPWPRRLLLSSGVT